MSMHLIIASLGLVSVLALVAAVRHRLLIKRINDASDDSKALKNSLLVSGDAVWEFDGKTKEWHWDLPADWSLKMEFAPGEAGLLPMRLVHPDDASQADATIQRFQSDKDAHMQSEFRLMDTTGRWRWVRICGSWVRSVNQVRNCAVGTLRDIDMLRRQAEEDMLSGLGNRRAFTRTLSKSIATRNFSDSSYTATSFVDSKDGLALLYIDLDKFKQVNDTLGHQFGDKVLTEIAKRLSQCTDGQGQAFRLGGDEFAVLIDGGPAAIRTVHLSSFCQKILAAIKTPIEHDGVTVVMTASIGAARFPYDGQDLESLSRSADAAMYQAKRSGRNSFRLHRPGQNNENRDVLHLESALRRALPLGEFELVFQPRVTLSDKKFIGREALMRWRHPNWGSRPVESIVRTIEGMDLVHEFGFWVIDAALSSHEELALEFSGIRTSINISGKQLQKTEFPLRLKELLSRHGTNPSSISLELTESVLISEFEGINANLYALRALGVQLVADDFGKGYSSLAYLRRLPITGVKIDKMFVDDIHINKQSRVFIENLLALLEPLHLEITAEGIEHESQLEILAQLGCAYGQGYLIGRPMSPHSEAVWAREQRCIDSLPAPFQV